MKARTGMVMLVMAEVNRAVSLVEAVGDGSGEDE